MASTVALSPMARFANLGYRQLLPLRPFPCVSRASHFTTSSILRAARQQASRPRKIPAVSPSKPKPKTAPASPAAAAIPPTNYAFIKSLVGKSTPTTLYEGPSHFWFYFGCWSSGVGILTWAGLTGPSLIVQPGDLPTWITVTYAASYVILCAMGFYLISRTHNIISLIRVLPASAGGKSASPLQMEVTVKSMLPFKGPSKVVTDVNNAKLRSRLSLPEEMVPHLRRQSLEQEKAARKELHKFDMNHLLTMPFRRMGRAFVALFNGVRGAWTDMGFGKMRINGKEYKIDVTNGFAHDGFRTLEKLLQMD